MLRDTIIQCKERLPMPELWRRLGLEVPRQFKSFCSPFRADKEPSASVFQVGKLWFFKDHATSESFDEIGLIQRHSGCDKAQAIKDYHALAGVELEVRGEKLSASGGVRSRGDLGKIVAVYDYFDAHGNLVHQTVRYEPKRFLQRRPAAPGMRAGNKEARRDPNGKWWIWTLEGIEPVLYRLPQLLSDPHKPVVICEGEKDADELAKREPMYCTTTAPMGAGKWRDSYTVALKGRDVALSADHDSAGKNHNIAVAEKLLGPCKRVRLLNWAKLCVGVEIPKGFDIYDYLAGVTAAVSAA